MATALTTLLKLTGNIRETNAQDLSTPTDQINIGTGTSGSQGFSELVAEWASGTSDNQANEWFHDQRTVAATTADNLDLAGTLTNRLTGATITFTVIKLMLFRIISPDGTKALAVGPRNQTNAWAGPWVGGVGATVYDDVKDWMVWVNRYGWGTITAGSADVLGVYNSSASQLTYDVILIGEK